MQQAISVFTKGSRLTEVVGKLRELVDVFTRVATVGNAETEVKVKALEQASLEVMPLDHAEAVYGSVAHRELHTGENNAVSKYEKNRRSSRKEASCTDILPSLT